MTEKGKKEDMIRVDLLAPPKKKGGAGKIVLLLTAIFVIVLIVSLWGKKPAPPAPPVETTSPVAIPVETVTPVEITSPTPLSLEEAIRSGDLQKIVDFVVAGEDTIFSLIAAVETELEGENRIGLFQMLIDAGASPNARDSDARTPLHLEILRDNPDPEVIRLLIESGASTNAKDKDGNTPSDLAVMRFDPDGLNPPDSEIWKALRSN